MQPIDTLLDRIKWDREFGSATFALGYYDRVARREVVVPLAAVKTGDAAGAFTFEDERGIARAVPFHRIRTVYRDGVAIWRRPQKGARP